MTDVHSTFFAKVVPELLVTNFAESRRFYVGILGFTVLYDRPETNSPTSIWAARRS